MPSPATQDGRSAVATTPTTQEPESKLTLDDYMAFPEDGRRHEVLDGQHVVSPPPNIRHQRVVTRLLRWIADHADAHDLGEILPAPVGVELGPHDIPEPDLVFVARDQAEIVGARYISGQPALLVEVLSTDKRRDAILKRARYQAAGVLEYWLVDPELDTVEVLRLDEAGVYQTASRVAVHTGGGVVESHLLPGLAIDVEALFVRR